MKITLLSDDAIRLTPEPGPLTIEAQSLEQSYSPFHMLASSLATCTFSVMHSWATHADLQSDDLAIEVHWTFADDPQRVGEISVVFEWPSLPERRPPRRSECRDVHRSRDPQAAAANQIEGATPAAGAPSPAAQPSRDGRDPVRHESGDCPSRRSPSTDRTRLRVAGSGGVHRRLRRQLQVCGRLVKVLRAWDRRNEIEVGPRSIRRHGALSWIPARAYVEAVQMIGPAAALVRRRRRRDART